MRKTLPSNAGWNEGIRAIKWILAGGTLVLPCVTFYFKNSYFSQHLACCSSNNIGIFQILFLNLTLSPLGISEVITVIPRDKLRCICAIKISVMGGLLKTLDHWGPSAVVLGLRLCLPMQGVWVWSLVRELRSHMPCSQKTET